MAMARTARGRASMLLAFAAVATMCMALSGGTALAAAGGQRAAHHHLKDADHDGLPNAWERRHHTHVHRKDAAADPDHDGLKNLGEYRMHTLPHVADTDHDGLFDGAEVHTFDTNPRQADTNHDGIDDGSEDGNHDGVVDEGEDGDGVGFVGTIVAYDAGTGKLVFESDLGWPITALVTSDTRVRFTEGCWADSPSCYLVEGQDIAEMRFTQTPEHGVPVVKWIVLVCPPAD